MDRFCKRYGNAALVGRIARLLITYQGFTLVPYINDHGWLIWSIYAYKDNRYTDIESICEADRVVILIDDDKSRIDDLDSVNIKSEMIEMSIMEGIYLA